MRIARAALNLFEISVKKGSSTALIVASAYCAVYILGQPLAYRHEVVSRVWATAFYPLRLVQFRNLYSGVRHEQGTFHRHDKGGWLLTYLQPQGNPSEGLTRGISFRVPPDLVADVEASGGRPCAVTLGKEPDLEHFNCARFVLRSVAPLP